MQNYTEFVVMIIIIIIIIIIIVVYNTLNLPKKQMHTEKSVWKMTA